MNNYAHLTPGATYTLRGQGEYKCLSVSFPMSNNEASLRRVSDGYELKAHGTQINPDGTIEWDFSTGGHWPKKRIHEVRKSDEMGHDYLVESFETLAEASDYINQYAHLWPGWHLYNRTIEE